MDYTNILLYIGYATVALVCLAFNIDLAIKHRDRIRLDRLASRRLGLPHRTPTGERASDCMIGTTAILSHLLEEVEPRSTSQVHEEADRLMVARGHTGSWEEWIDQDPHNAMGLLWLDLLRGLGMANPRMLWFEHNHELAGKGLLVITGPEGDHAVAYAHGLISDPSRESSSPTWETLADVLARWQAEPLSVHVFEDCTDGVVGHVRHGGHSCTYREATHAA